MKIVIFGTGRFYQDKRHKISSDYEIIAFLDNNSALQGQSIDGALVFAPDKILQLSYDKVILMSASEEAMKSQLIELGVDKKDIWYWERFASEMYRGRLQIFCGSRNKNIYKKKVLIVSSHLNYTGGPIAAVYAAQALQARGYAVCLAAPSGEQTFIDEMSENGINILLCPVLPYVHKEELMWIRQFDTVLVNVFPMLICACGLAGIKPVLWWIHESEERLYRNIINRYEEYVKREELEDVHIYAVSKVAQSKFNSYFPNRIKKILSYGIPDQKEMDCFREITSHLVFALIGTVHPGKAPDIFVKAIGCLSGDEKKNVEFLIIGPIGGDDYGTGVREQALKEPSIHIIGPLTRDEINKAYEKIDVVICPSLEDSLPIVVTEGMMHGKVCIVSDAIGTAEYIEDGVSSLICKTGNPEDLCEKMRWVIGNREKLETMGNRARKIYEKYFTMDAFGQRLENALQETMDDFEQIRAPFS